MIIKNKTLHGKLLWCKSCQVFHVEFNNLLFSIKADEFDKFRAYFLNLDGNYWENNNKKSIYDRKILVPINHNSLTFLLNQKELNEIKDLLSNNSTQVYQTTTNNNFNNNLSLN